MTSIAFSSSNTDFISNDMVVSRRDMIYARHQEQLEAALSAMPWLQDPVPTKTQTQTQTQACTSSMKTEPTTTQASIKSEATTTPSSPAVAKPSVEKKQVPPVVINNSKSSSNSANGIIKGGLSSFFSKKTNSKSNGVKRNSLFGRDNNNNNNNIDQDEDAGTLSEDPVGSTDFTVQTADSEAEHVWAEIQVVQEETQAKISVMEQSIAEHEELAQVHYMTRNHTAALQAMRTVHEYRQMIVLKQDFSLQLTDLQASIDIASSNHHDSDSVRDQLADLEQAHQEECNNAAAICANSVTHDKEILLAQIRKLML